MNKELADLTKEQLQQQEQASKTPGQSNATAGGGKTKNRNGKGKLGTSKSKPVKQASTMDDRLEEIDDIAYLDKQIQTVQTSHGRKVVGKGDYHLIINDILIAKLPPREAKKNTA
jgi:hypothetical protein